MGHELDRDRSQRPKHAYVGNYGSGAAPAGYWKVKIDLANLTALPDESWGEGRGYVPWERTLFDSADAGFPPSLDP